MFVADITIFSRAFSEQCNAIFYRALHMKEHPDYKYRPRRKPKHGQKKEPTTRYPFPLPMQVSHLTPSMLHSSQGPSANTNYQNAHNNASLSGFNRTMFPADLLSSGLPPMSNKSPIERAEMNYSRLLFASQMPSLHLGFASMAHPLHSVQLPWYHYDSSVFHQLNATQNHRHLLESQLASNESVQKLSLPVPNLAASEEDRGEPSSPSSSYNGAKSPVPNRNSPAPSKMDKNQTEGRISSSSSGSLNRPPSVASSYTSNNDTVECRHNKTQPWASPSPMAAESAFTAPSSLVAANLLPFPYASYHPSYSVSCNCSPICVIQHDQANRSRCPMPSIL